MTRQFVRMLATVGVVLALSCSPSHPPVGVVTGKLTCKSKPIEYGSVMFVPARGTPATGSIAPDGTYRLSTFGDGDGALVGEHKVVIEGYRIIPARVKGVEDDAVPVAHKKYYNVTTTPLTAVVKPGENVIDFDLE